MTFRGCVAPTLPWVLCEPPALLGFVLSWGLFLSPLIPGCWKGLSPPFRGDTGSPSAGFCDGPGGVTVKGTREELSAVRSRGIRTSNPLELVYGLGMGWDGMGPYNALVVMS